jgi:hypothetical protein
MDSSEAQLAPGFWGPRSTEPRKSDGPIPSAIFSTFKDEKQGDLFEVAHCDLSGSTDEGDDDFSEDDGASSQISSAAATPRSIGLVEAETFSAELKEESAKAQQLGPLLRFGLPQELLMLQVLIFIPVLGRTLCSKAHALLEQEEGEATQTGSPSGPGSQRWLPAGFAPTFPLRLNLRRHFSTSPSLVMEYTLVLTSLQAWAALELHEKGEEDDDGLFQPFEKSTELPPGKVQLVFEELIALRAKYENQREVHEPGRKHFEVTVEDAKGCLAMKHVYCYRFPRTPVDALLEAMLSGPCSESSAEDEDEDEDLNDEEEI